MLKLTPRTLRRTGWYLVALVAARPAAAQDTRRAYASRAELEATLVEIEQVVQSPGYSARLKDAKRREAQLIRQRLADGDLQVGDQLVIQVEGIQEFSDTFTVATGRALILPGNVTIPVQGVLRSEAEAHIAARLAEVVRNPVVRVEPRIRLSILGQVGRPGFYHLPADMLASDAIMFAGGISGQTDPSKTRVRRGGREIVSQEEFRDVLVQGVTLDQLNLRAGDELIVDPVRTGGFSAATLFGAASLLSSLVFLITRF
jgi:protein involved in polysaccharide export with SLBB domain